MSTQDFLDDALGRAETLTDVYIDGLKAKVALEEGAARLEQHVTLDRQIPARVRALTTLLEGSMEDFARERAANVRQVAWLLARQIAESVRDEHGPIVWLTGNSYVPPLRDMPAAERIWMLGYHERLSSSSWEEFVEALESALDNEQIYMGAPDYDNALYGVDLRVWEHVDESDDESDDPDSLSAEWRKIDRST